MARHRSASTPIRSSWGLVRWMPTAIMLASIFVSPPQPAVAGGEGFGPAPPCNTDVWREHTLAEAYNAVKEAQAIVAASGPGLVYPELGTARALMTHAWSRLEQILNQGILKWSNHCMSCDPTKGVPSYLDVANALVAVSRLVYDRPDYGEYLGLVETAEINMTVLDYCGFYATSLIGTPYLDKIDGCWEFGRTDGTILQLDLRLTQAGGGSGLTINKRPHPNETYYWPLGNEIVFLHPDRSVTSIFRQTGDKSYSGPYISHPGLPLEGVDHYLKRRTWQLAATRANPAGNPLQFVHPPGSTKPQSREYWTVGNDLLARRLVPDTTVAPLLAGAQPDLRYSISTMAPQLVAGEPETLTTATATAQGYDPNKITSTAFQLWIDWGANPLGVAAIGQWNPVNKVMMAGKRHISINKSLQMNPEPPFDLDVMLRCDAPKHQPLALIVSGGTANRPGRIEFEYQEE